MSKANKLVVLGVACASSLVLVEVVARACFAVPEYFEGHPFDAELGFTSIPGTRFTCCDGDGTFPWTLNESASRGPDLPARGSPARAGVPRLLFVGDSFLAGWNVREEALIPFSAQAALAGQGLETECFSVSCSGYGTGQELLLLRKYGERVRPDFVVLCMYTGNDVVDNSLDLAGLTTVSNGAWVRPYFVPDENNELEPSHLHPLRAWFRRYSRTFTLLDHRAFRHRYREHGQYVREKAGRPVDQSERLRLGLIPSADLELFLEPSPGDEWDRAWRTTEELIALFDREVRELGARLVVVVIPHMLQVESNALFRQIDAAALDAGQSSLLETLNWNLPEPRLGAFLRAKGIAHLSLLAHLRADLRASGVSGYLHDGHLNSRGHALAGSLVASLIAALRSNGEPAPAGTAQDGPVDVLAQLFARGDLRFTEPIEDVIGYGWVGWACDWYGLGPAWAMTKGGWLVLPRDPGKFVIQAQLPPGMRLPVYFQLSAAGKRLGPRIGIETLEPFELPIVLDSLPPGVPPWVPVLIEASHTVAAPGRQEVGLLLKGLRPAD